ncbi:MAG: hypothetical protein ACLFWD_13540 [Anaerolineales bacterium]
MPLSWPVLVAVVQSPTGEAISIVNTSVCLLNPEVRQVAEQDGRRAFEQDLFLDLTVIGRLSAFVCQGTWHDVRQEDS